MPFHGKKKKWGINSYISSCLYITVRAITACRVMETAEMVNNFINNCPKMAFPTWK
jgi:hypothetical protein